MLHINLLGLHILLFCSLALAQTPSRYEGKQNNWWKGNSHSHPKRQIGVKSTSKLYHENNYDYLVLTEHRVWLDDTEVTFTPKRSSFLVIQGEEFNSNRNRKTKHITVINSTAQLGDIPKKSTTDSEHFNMIYALVSEKNGFPIINHPTWGGDLKPADFAKIKGFQHFELFNGAQDTDTYGIYGTGLPSTEKLWDDILTAGTKWYGVGADDFHRIGPNKASASSPFTGWTMLKTSTLSVDSVLAAYKIGRFYASNGVQLVDLTTDLGLYKISIDTQLTNFELTNRDTAGWANPAKPVKEGTPGYRIDFIGSNGTILKTVNGLSGEYQATKNDAYVRGRVTFLREITPKSAPYINEKIMKQQDYIRDSSMIKEEYYAWGQPFFTDARHEGGAPKFGCTDTSYLEYDNTANITDVNACKNKNVSIRNKQYDFDGINGINIKVGKVFGNYSIELRSLNGQLLKTINSNLNREHDLNNLTTFKRYIVVIKGQHKSIQKMIMVK